MKVFFSSREDAEKATKKLNHRLTRVVDSDKVSYSIIGARLDKLMDNEKLWSAEME